MSDSAAFLQAIVASPADDTARLVYADFLEETGEPVHAARAEFIRVQIEADRLHRNHPRRAKLEARAEELFAEHWIDWWMPVCAAVGLPRPVVPREGLRSSLLRFMGQRPTTPGHPYSLESGTRLGWARQAEPDAPDRRRSVAFERGFPQALSLPGELIDAAMPVRRWSSASPLTSLDLHGTSPEDWRRIDGEHLRGVRELSLRQVATAALRALAASPDLPALEEVTLHPGHSNPTLAEEQYRAFACSSIAARVKRLNVVVRLGNDLRVMGQPDFSSLEALHIRYVSSFDWDPDDVLEVTEACRLLLASSNLSGLTELSLTGPLFWNPGDLQGTAFAGQLNTLELNGLHETARLLNELLINNEFPALTDLSVVEIFDIDQLYAVLADSPLMNQLRHLRVLVERATAPPPRRFFDALNSDRLETLVLDRHVQKWPGIWHDLQERFPGRVMLE